ncbi:DNA-binding winged helix-turn-helix (wHTH) domain-containing protein [Izhakiella capsodis]|uniref:DNA-binding winged helix-turn-helix (WHTH) domain-containing protein n=1 Tax=Izhakiella capsodis TaxID=1367852 RepID=A0A1I4YAF0_9GAMM|nr:DNA-binding winged helix-turn-helix (wHTH) domain-containing protein [Izhakiella capsodis]
MNAKFTINNWLLDGDSSSLIHKESHEQRRLGEFQFRLLQVLADNAGKILSRDELNAKVWEKRVIGNNSLPNAVHALRVALDDNSKQKFIIKTIPKKGYMLEAEYCQNLTVQIEPVLADGAEIWAQPLHTKETVDSSYTQMPEARSRPTTITTQFRPNKLWQRLFLVQMALVFILSAVLVKSLFLETKIPEVLSHNLWDNVKLAPLLPTSHDEPYERLSHLPSQNVTSN